MKPFSLREAVQATGGRYFGSEEALNREITFVTSDSRTAAQGGLFIAFKGARADGHDFMTGCLEKGCAACISEREPACEAEMPCIVVESSLKATGALAAWHRSRFDIPVIGITGSVGKTTTKEMIAAVLSKGFETHKTEKNFNNELGVPQTLLRLDDAHQASVVEMGISDFGEMRRLTNMVRPDIAVFSVIGYSHLEFLGDREGVLRAKAEIFEGMKPDGLAILNGDDELLSAYVPSVRKVTYGLNPGNDFRAEKVENLGTEGIRCTIRHKDGAFEARIPAFGSHMVYAALAGAAAGKALGMKDEDIAAGIASYRTVGDRARVIHANDLTIISDCYNANPNSTTAAINSLAQLEGRKVCILGDMMELGSDENSLHFGVGEHAAKTGIDLVIACGNLSLHTYEGAKQAGAEAMYFEDKPALFAKLSGIIKKGDNVLVKASHSRAFEEIVKVLSE
ncbi:MAG: UDP-N-acetylmuramoyl-tripeptide--D-alanyl-D-alanine ligase [Clostridia bacterium]|nr:UDP-N-acetylmuramoyl-tripeptide--D-alanyl-D-alanine ligase [Clostridia bacterium]